MTNRKPETVPAKAASKKSGQFEYQGYVNCDMRVADKQAFLVWAESVTYEDILYKLEALLDSGYKLAWGEGKIGMSAALSNVEGPPESRGYILSAQASSAVRALQALLYKHFMMLEEQWPVGEPAGEEFYR